jgi:hypothetical protein
MYLGMTFDLSGLQFLRLQNRDDVINNYTIGYCDEMSIQVNHRVPSSIQQA